MLMSIAPAVSDVEFDPGTWDSPRTSRTQLSKIQPLAEIRICLTLSPFL